jgi:CHASE3 domain sensor protein
MVVSQESENWVRHTHEVLATLQDIQFATESIQSSYRGFALTGDESYLESYQVSKLSAQQDEAMVRDLTVDNPAQQGRLPTLQSLTAQKIQFADLVITLRRTRGLEAAANALQNGTGERIRDEFQEVIRQMRDEEQRLLVLRDADAKRRLSQSRSVLILGTVLGLCIAAGAGWTVQHDFAARELAEEALREEEERFHNLANNISQLAWMADEKGSIFWYNQRWFDYSGTTLEEMAGSGWQKVHHPDHLQRVVDKISKCFLSGEVWEDTFPSAERTVFTAGSSPGRFRSAIPRERS